MRILGIETSCDDTAVCFVDASGDFGSSFKFQMLGNAAHSQAMTHSLYGGVFPNLAKQMHAKNLVPLLEHSLNQGGMLHTAAKKGLPMSFLEQILEREPELYEQLTIFLQKYARPEIDVIAVTVGPGLEPALWAGINLARALSLLWNLPVVPVNHMEGHMLVALLRAADSRRLNAEERGMIFTLHDIKFPALALLVSGGHTELVHSVQWMKYEIIGETRDDAVGEAFDKVARMLGLPYPGGPHISKLAESVRGVAAPEGRGFTLPRPMIHDPSFDFSFAGLKTAVRRVIGAKKLSEREKAAIAREFEDAAVDVLVEKSRRAAEEFGARTLVVGGGVSANKHLRKELGKMAKESNIELFISLPEFTGDNAVMIALAGYFRAQNKEFADPHGMRADGNLRLG